MTASRLGVAAVCAAVSMICVACGTGQRETDSGAAAANFLAAVGDGDTRAACALLATDTRRELEYAEREPCGSSLRSVDLTAGAVDDVEVWGDRARARTASGTLFLVELDAGWRVAAAGCARTADGTYDCRLAA